MKRIGLLGLSFTDPNKGCEALTYTFLNMLSRICPDTRIEIVCYVGSNDLGGIPEYFPQFDFKTFFLNIYSIRSWIDVYNDIKKCDCVFDGSYGDGFTGIYGTRRNFVQALRKQLVISANKPLYLLPQTYGLYKFPFKNWSIGLIKKASFAYARDTRTAQSVGSFVKVTSDMAFGLPYKPDMYRLVSKKLKIGINVSSLLWEKTGDRFNLSVDYQKFYHKILDYLTGSENYEVHLIPHVVDLKNYDSPENDCKITDLLKGEYGDKVILAPSFKNTIEAKSYISNMDVFMGSRMHATIGAISSGVATIPFSYCHKFESLYGNIGYPYLIEATKVSTEDAYKTFISFLSIVDEMRIAGNKSVTKAKEMLNQFEMDLKSSLEKQNLI